MDPIPELVRGPEYEIHIILLKLLDNACKFTGKGQVQVSLAAPAYQSEDDSTVELVYAVRDAGSGIPEKLLQDGKILEPFRQGDPSSTRLHEGLGMGLALCHRLTHQVGGSLQIRNNEDQGSTVTFTVTLEIQAPEIS